MRKILVSLLAVSGSSAFAAAADYSQFQAFDDQVSIGYGMQQTTSTAWGGGNNNITSSNNIYFNAERLLNDGIWIDLGANMSVGQSSSQLNANTPAGVTTTTPAASNYGFNGKVGYAFPLLGQHLLLTPYALVGLNNNAIAETQYVSANNVSDNNGAPGNQMYWTGGAGARLEYRINHVFLVYADQNALYNWDQTGYNNGLQPQNNIQFTSTLGAKFNIVKDFQLGVAGFYNNYQPQASSGNQTGYAYPQLQSSVGGLVTVGMTY